MEKATKTTAILISVIVSYLSLTHMIISTDFGIYRGCNLSCRLLYPFFHVNLLHAALNAWCLLSVVFIYNTSFWKLLFSYIVAVTIPPVCLSNIPTIGLSGVVFALFGSISFEVQRKAYYQLWMLAYLVTGFFFPNTNALVHLYCYLAGGAVAVLNKPVNIG